MMANLRSLAIIGTVALPLVLAGCPTGDDDDTVEECPATETPQVDIVYPGDTSVWDLGEPIQFAASVSDDVDDPGDLDLRWTDKLYGDITEFEAPPPDGDGVIQFLKDDFTEGIHIVTLEATDTGGCMGKDDVPFCVGAVGVCE